MVHYSFENKTLGIFITVSAPNYDAALGCLSDSCKNFKSYIIANIGFDYVRSDNTIKTPDYRPLGIRLNNPLNIRYNKRNNWLGQKGEKFGFCDFFSPVYGFRAALLLLCNYIKRGINTVELIINRFAPSSENNTDDYIKFVCKHSFILFPDCTIKTFADVKSLCWAMCRYELGYKQLSNTQLSVLGSCLDAAATNYKYPIS